MINSHDNDTTRAEKLSISIDETEKEITEYQVLIQQIENLKDENCSVDISEDFNNLIEKYESQITFLEDNKESDEIQLNSCLNNEEIK